ncbi:MAG: hypothetical protein NTW20_14920 [Rhodobacterales bacterium]|nr:hypothetical protein [Rhodobacterales bacterium]
MLDPDRRFILVTNNHRASIAAAGLNTRQQVGQPSQVVLAGGTRVRQVLEDHVLRQGLVGAPPRAGWHFLPMPGTTLRIRSGEGSAKHLADIGHLHPERVSDDADGFAHYRLHL